MPLAALTLIACDSDGDTQTLSDLVTIAEEGFTGLVINGDTETIIETGQSTQLSLEALTENTINGTAISAAMADWSSSDEQIATVDTDTGAVTGGNVDGEVTVTARFGNLTASTQVRVSSAQLVSIIVDQADSELNECSDTRFTAMGMFEGEERLRNITDSIVWTVAQASAAFDENNLLRVSSAGELEVTATREAFLDRLAVNQTATVNVLDNLEGITIVADPGQLAVRSPLQYRAFPVYSNMPDVLPDITDNLQWDIEDVATSGDFARVDNTLPDKGLVTALRSGDGLLLASCNGTQVTQTVNITAAGSGEFAGLSISAENSARDFPLQVTWQGEEIVEQLVATALFLDQEGGEDVTFLDETEWQIETVSEPGIFTLGNDDDDKGQLTIRGVGRVTLRATFIDEDNDDVVFMDTVTVISQ